jgi:hypothetical protein
MNILLVSPLYPPDISEPAPYVKRLSRELASRDHTVTIVTYGYIPEEVPSVSIHATRKDRSRFIRIISYTRSLYRHFKEADVVIALNGPSVELPLLLVSLMAKTPFIFHVSDTRAFAHSQQHLPLQLLFTLVSKRASHIIYTEIPQRPEILPFTDTSTDRAGYESWWQEQLEGLMSLIRIYGR